jgi:hypothetical protein
VPAWRFTYRRQAGWHELFIAYFKARMKAIHLALIIIFSSLSSLAQQYDVNKWVELLKDDSKSQYISHYKVYLDITKIDSASKIRAANEIAAACAKGNKHLKLMGRSVKAKIFFYHIRPDDSLYAAQMKDCLNEAIEMDDPYLQSEFGRWYSEILKSMKQTEIAMQ